MQISETNRPEGSQGPPQVAIEKLIYGGDGLGRIEGRVVFAPFVLPGEQVRVEVERERPGRLEARLVEVVQPSAERTEPPCPYFFRCGGCQYQHANYPYQLQQKQEILRDLFQRLGKMAAPEDIRVIAGEPWNYRNRTQFHLERGEIGYFAFRSHDLVPVDHCPISSPAINDALRALREMMRDRRFPKFVRAIELFTNETAVQVNIRESEGGRGVARGFFEWAAERIPGAAAGTLEYRAANEVFRVGHESFFQVNRYLIDQMVEAALEGAQGDTALDLYAGVGLFSLPLARRMGTVAAVESGGSAARDLAYNAERAGVKVDVHRASAEAFLEEYAGRPDFVLADPPRAGLGKRVVKRLAEMQPARLTVVSCDPATLARDVAGLVAAGYRLQRVTVIDLFPQTYHIESIVQMAL